MTAKGDTLQENKTIWIARREELKNHHGHPEIKNQYNGKGCRECFKMNDG